MPCSFCRWIEDNEQYSIELEHQQAHFDTVAKNRAACFPNSSLGLLPHKMQVRWTVNSKLFIGVIGSVCLT